MIRKLLSITYGWLVAEGAFAAIAPRWALAANARLTLSGFENVGELEPKEWYVDAARAAGVGMLAAGLVGLATERARGASGDADSPAESPVAIETRSEDEN
ncbi:hypothetical protein [Halomicrobium salinisoli]|uniref:hypothetical protein n=1 Tax=Halomicrobium salinisoli TaxID=2878391 RepID=UPI001CEFCD56|nr:hypothetical protein [Halomicrobium salinisoli]